MAETVRDLIDQLENKDYNPGRDFWNYCEPDESVYQSTGEKDGITVVHNTGKSSLY